MDVALYKLRILRCFNPKKYLLVAHSSVFTGCPAFSTYKLSLSIHLVMLIGISCVS